MATKSTKRKQTENKNIEREYTIPLRKKFEQKPIYKKAPAAVKAIKIFLIRHMKIRDKDLNRIKINKYLNEYLWFRGIKKPPAKVKIRAVKEEAGTENEKVLVYLSELPEKLKFKQKREEKLAKQAEEKTKESAKKAKEEVPSETKEEIVKDIEKSGKVSKEVAEKEEEIAEEITEETDAEKEKKSKAEDEKKASVEDANLKTSKEAYKKQKHTSGGKHKDQTAPKRQALKK